MKRTIALVLLSLLLLILCGCAAHKEVQVCSISDEEWNDETFNISFVRCVPDKETAIKIADAVVDALKKEKPSWEPGKLSFVSYEPDRGVWIVTYQEPDWNPFATKVGGCVSVYISETDGRVIKICPGE